MKVAERPPLRERAGQTNSKARTIAEAWRQVGAYFGKRRLNMSLTKIAGVVALVVGTLCATAHAQNYPNKQIKVILPGPVGGSTDVTCRVFLDQFRKVLDQPMVVDNRPGAGSNVGGALAARANDPHTLLCTGFATHVLNPFLYASMGFDPEKELVPVMAITESPFLLLVNNKLRGKTAAEVLAMVRAAPKPPSVGTASSSAQIVLAMVSEAAQVKLLNVPYGGSNRNLITDLIRDELDFVIDPTPGSRPAVSNGQITALATTASKRSSYLPDVPTFMESGINVAGTGWTALYAPGGTSPEIIAILNKAGNEALKDPAVVQRLATLSTVPVGGSAAALEAMIRRDRASWGGMIKKLGLKAE